VDECQPLPTAAPPQNLFWKSPEFQGLTLVPISAQLELTFPLSAQLELTVLFQLNLSLLCPQYDSNEPVDVPRRCSS